MGDHVSPLRSRPRIRPRPINFEERLQVVRLYGPKEGREDLDVELEAFLRAQEAEHARVAKARASAKAQQVVV
jgi:hypothetical protein